MIRKETIPIIKCGTMYIPGSFALFKDNKAFILTRNGSTALVDKDVAECLQQGVIPPESRSYLIQRGVLQPNTPAVEDNVVTYFIIDLVKNCNFDCIYCFRDLQDKRIISWEMLDKILYFIKAYCEEKKLYRIGLQMWGGEPLLAMDRIEYIVDFFKKSKITASIDIETNASLVTDETAKKLYESGIHIGVSIDGTPHLQNLQRPFVNGKPTSEKVEEGIKNLQKYYGDSLGGITVVTQHNYRYIKEMMDHYIYHLQMKAVKFNIVRDNPNAAAQGLSLNEDEIKWFANELLDYLYAFKSLGKYFSEGNIDVRVRNLLHQCRNNLCLSHGCRGGRNIISFSQSGGVFPCEMTDFAEVQLGSISPDNSLDEMIITAAENNRFFEPKEAEKCKTCPWWPYCQGGCTSRNRYMGVIGKPDECECALNRVIYPRIVEEIIDGHIGG